MDNETVIVITELASSISSSEASVLAIDHHEDATNVTINENPYSIHSETNEESGIPTTPTNTHTSESGVTFEATVNEDTKTQQRDDNPVYKIDTKITDYDERHASDTSSPFRRDDTLTDLVHVSGLGKLSDNAHNISIDSAYSQSCDGETCRSSESGSTDSQNTATMAGIPILTEITLGTRFKHSISQEDTSQHDEFSGTSGIESYEGSAHCQFTRRSSSGTVEPYAISDIRIHIPDTDISSSYQNPYTQFITDFEHSSASASNRSGTNTPGSSSLARSSSLRTSHPGDFTRQLNVFIGEEWESGIKHIPLQRKSRSCPPTLRVSRNTTVRQPIRTNTRPLRQLTIGGNRRHHSIRGDRSRQFFYHMTTNDAPNQLENFIKPNPYNNFNHKVHSLLHCPCCFFFFLLCCMPGVHFMQEADVEYKRGHEDKARLHARRATFLFIIGGIIGTATLSLMAYFAVTYVQSQIQFDQG